jgi:Zinc carboxypeptidase
MSTTPVIPLDRFLRYSELSSLLQGLAAAYPELMSIEAIGVSHEGRDIWLVTITDSSTGSHADKPAHWVDANIHSVELTASVAALALIERLLSGFGTDDTVTRAVKTRTFYVVPRVNPDGAELAMADNPRYLRSSVRMWPWADGHRNPGLHMEDIDGDGRVLQMRVIDPHGPFTTHPDDDRVMIPIPIDGNVGDRQRYRVYAEGRIDHFDGYTVPRAPGPQRLDLNRNWPAGWGTNIPGSGDFPGSEPEVAALIKAIASRPNICGTNAFHTSGGVLLRPSSTKPDGQLPPMDVWTWTRLGERMNELTGYPVHGLFDDFTWDKNDVMAGAADDWSYEHLGVFAWTTEFWDIVHAATGTRATTDIWYVGPTPDQNLAILKWVLEQCPQYFVDWHTFDHPELGSVELGGLDWMHCITNPPPSHLPAEVRPHADANIAQALAAPELTIGHTGCVFLGTDTWRIDIGLANIGWLPTYVSAHAEKTRLVRPIVVEITGAEVIGGPGRMEVGQLEGAYAWRFDGTDGTPDRSITSFVVRASAGVTVSVSASHQRAGRSTAAITIG